MYLYDIGINGLILCGNSAHLLSGIALEDANSSVEMGKEKGKMQENLLRRGDDNEVA